MLSGNCELGVFASLSSEAYPLATPFSLLFSFKSKAAPPISIFPASLPTNNFFESVVKPGSPTSRGGSAASNPRLILIFLVVVYYVRPNSVCKNILFFFIRNPG